MVWTQDEEPEQFEDAECLKNPQNDGSITSTVEAHDFLIAFLTD